MQRTETQWVLGEAQGHRLGEGEAELDTGSWPGSNEGTLPGRLHSQHHPPPPCRELAVHLHQKLFIRESENVGDGGCFIVQAEAGEEQEQGRGRGTPLLPRAVTETLSCLAHGPDETHDEALTDTLAAELALWGGRAQIYSRSPLPGRGC